MRILAIESASLVASVALYEDGMIVGEFTLNDKKTHSQTLLPMLEFLREMLGERLGEPDALAVCSGPGSFTGLRIGLATAKGIAFALQKPLIPVPTLDALAYQLFGSDALIVPMLDARRAQVYTGLYRFRDEFEILAPARALSIRSLMEELNERGERVLFLGDGVPVYGPELEKGLRVPFRFVPSPMNRQRAGALASLGARCFLEKKAVAPEDFTLDYLRKSQAEREREALEAIRPALLSDAKEMAALEAAVFSDAYSLGLIERSLSSPHEHSLIFERDRQLEGYITWLETGEEAELLRIAVHPEKRRQSVGKQLLGAMLSRRYGLGAASVSLEVRASNRAARSLYASFGFREIGRRKDYYENPREDGIIMRIEGFER